MLRNNKLVKCLTPLSLRLFRCFAFDLVLHINTVHLLSAVRICRRFLYSQCILYRLFFPLPRTRTIDKVNGFQHPGALLSCADWYIVTGVSVERRTIACKIKLPIFCCTAALLWLFYSKDEGTALLLNASNYLLVDVKSEFASQEACVVINTVAMTSSVPGAKIFSFASEQE